jgi:hypothetical protein
MRDDDDVLSDYDLSAWDVPPPSPGLADAVIARAQQPAAVAASEDPIARPVRRWWIGGVVVFGIASTLAVALWGLQRAPKDGSGDVIAAQAQVVELGPSSAQLDPGAEVHWRRDKHRVTVAQSRGAASWTVHGDDTFVIDAGATVASVEASGASLRVEVTMNVSDARVIGASVLTAVVVAMVTVVVYEGHVKVASGGQTVIVEPGSRLEIRNPALAPPPVAVGASPDALAEKDREIANLRHQLEVALRSQKTAEPPLCDQVSCALNNNEGECCQRFKKTPKQPPPATASCDAAALAKKGDDNFGAGMFAAALAAYESSQQCKPDNMVLRKAGLAACRSKNGIKARAIIAKLPGDMGLPVAQICIREGIDPKSTGCDAQALRDKGQDAMQIGADAMALEKFEASLACKPDAAVERLAFMSACRAKDVDRARRHYGNVPSTNRTGIIQICVRNGISEDMMQAAKSASTGTLRINATPPAKVFIDGIDSGETPVVANVAPGKHKLTLQVGDEKWSYAVTVAAGKTQTITKDLR